MNYKWLDDYLMSKLAVVKDFKVEWKWDRYLINGKMFAALCTDKSGKNIITVKCEPAFGEELRIIYEDIVPGYYMNKVHWNSVYLAGNVPDQVIRDMIDQSYELVFKKFSKKMQEEILSGSKK